MKLGNINYEGGLILSPLNSTSISEALKPTKPMDQLSPPYDGSETLVWDEDEDGDEDEYNEPTNSLKSTVDVLSANNYVLTQRVNSITQFNTWLANRVDNIDTVLRQIHGAVTKPGKLAQLFGKKQEQLNNNNQNPPQGSLSGAWPEYWDNRSR